MEIRRAWAMPNKNTFSVPPITALVKRFTGAGVWADPFANANRFAAHNNDLDPAHGTTHTMDALDFLKTFDVNSLDGVLFDPPYSPRQVAESYKALGMTVNMETTQGSYWALLKYEIGRIVKPCGHVLSFGWNSGGVGKKHGFEIQEILMVAHGGWHNDTICTVEMKLDKKQLSFL